MDVVCRHECIGGGRWRKVGSAAKNVKLIIHELLFSLFFFSHWRARGNELSRAEQGALKATSGNLTAVK